MYNPGDIIFLHGTGNFSDGIKCEILEVNAVTGEIMKLKALVPDDRLGKVGFLLEGEDWISFSWDFCRN